MPDFQQNDRVGTPQHTPAQFGSIQKGGCLCKKELYYILRPQSSSYNSRVIQAFFTDKLLNRCGISREELKRMRIFPVEVNFIVVTHLKTNQLI